MSIYWWRWWVFWPTRCPAIPRCGTGVIWVPSWHSPRAKILSDTDIRKLLGTVIVNGDQIDPTRQLKEAGYPFDHIGTELAALHGKFEVVSNDVMLLKETIAGETQKLSGKIDDSQQTVLEKVENLFDRKFLTIAGSIVGIIAVMYGAVTFLQSHGITGTALGIVAFLGGLGVLLVVYLLTYRKETKKLTPQAK
jgi:hypothetical protein